MFYGQLEVFSVAYFFLYIVYLNLPTAYLVDLKNPLPLS